ncbi:MAG: hypothetical protein AAGI24_06625 [Pseudomonadota bacterium]
MRSLLGILLLLPALCSGAFASDKFRAGEAKHAQNLVKQYWLASLQHDAERIVGLMYEGAISLRGGRSAAVEQLEHAYRLQDRYAVPPSQMELGEASLLVDKDTRIIVLPVRTTVPGFPKDMVADRFFVTVSFDDGESWEVMSPSCINRRLITPEVAHYVAEFANVTFIPSGLVITPAFDNPE